MYKNKLDTPQKKVLYTIALIQGNTKDQFEPILCNYLENENNKSLQDQDTQNIFSYQDNFKQALKDNFRVVNKEQQAAAEIIALRPHTSYAAHSAKFNQLAPKTRQDNEALIEIYYCSLKEEVKDKLYYVNQLDNLTMYIIIVIKINKQQYKC